LNTRRTSLIALIALTAVVLSLFAGSGTASAQSGNVITSGTVVNVTTDANGGLSTLSIVDSNGTITEFSVEPSTEYGLESLAGDRWVSTQSAEPVEAVSRLKDHQRRFAAVTVTSQNGVALSVVEREGGKLETNLGFLFAVFAITWAGFFAYIFFLSRKQRVLQREIALLRASLDEREDDK
jgi:CcmD family protein